MLFASDNEVDEMLEALGDGAGEPLRLTLSDEQSAALEGALGGGAPA